MAGYEVTEHIPDLISPEEYDDHPDGGLVRIRISVTPDGIEILGDAIRPDLLERILESLGPDTIEQMLCG